MSGIFSLRMKKITWAANVNTHVLDSTTIDVGKGYVEDSESSGTFSNRRLKSLSTPDSYNVTMVFDWSELDDDGFSEFDRFMRWYKYEHCRGVNPFEFPSITKFKRNGTEKISFYRITGDPSIQKEGLDYRVTMKWTDYVTEAISIPETSVTVNAINADPYDKSQYIYVMYTGKMNTIPSATSIDFSVNDESQEVIRVEPSYVGTNVYKFKISEDEWEVGDYEIVATYQESGETKTKSLLMRKD